MNIKYPEYDRSVLSISSSILAHYGIKPFHKTLPELDQMLGKNFKNVVMMIFDGMGSAILGKHLDGHAFLRTHKLADISSVFPPTTTASTVSMYTGLSPVEHGWLGWSLYFKEIDKNVNVFPNTLGGTEKTPAADFDVGLRYIPFENIFDKISGQNADVQAELIAPFVDGRINSTQVSSMPEIFDAVQRKCNEAGRHFLMTYWHNPDTEMHVHGTQSETAHSIIGDINRRIAALSEQLADTLMIITADHGQIDTEYRFITDFPAISECLARPHSIEARAANFFVKPGKKEQFKMEFNRHFGEDFMLLIKSQVIERKLFGEGAPHKKVDDFLGDYLAIAIGEVSLDYARPTWRDVYKGQHAGLTEDEMTVPLIIIEK